MVSPGTSTCKHGSAGEPIRRVLPLLKGVRERPGGGWDALCPAHEDDRPSLSVGVGKDGRVLLKCHACCTAEEVVAALGLTMSDLYADSANGEARRVVATYDYRDEAGCLCFQTVRYCPKDFRQRRPDGGGGWVWDLKGVERLLYRLPELAAADPSAPVFIPEGEKDVDRVRSLGLIATCNPLGAGKWRARFNGPLLGRHVVIIPDNDDAGRDHARKVSASLAGTAAAVTVLELPGLPDKGDVSDWLSAGGTKERLLGLARQAQDAYHTDDDADAGTGTPDQRAEFVTARELCAMKLDEVRYCVAGVLPEGAVILAGPPKIGKSWLALGLAVAVASGGKALGSIDVAQGECLYLALEDGKRRLRKRLTKVLRKWGGEAPERLHFCTECPKAGGGGVGVVRSWLKEHPECRLVIIDTLASMRDRRTSGADVYGADYADITPWQKLAREFGVTILIVGHTRKRRGEARDLDPLEEVSGSLGLTGALDTVLVLRRKRHEKTASLFLTGRDIEEERVMELRWEPEFCHWQAEQQVSGPDAGLPADRRAVRQAIRTAGHALAIPDAIAALKRAGLNKDYEATAKLLQRMEREGELQKEGQGRYGLPDGDVSKLSKCPNEDEDPEQTTI
jgi:hypothetical protein